VARIPGKEFQSPGGGYVAVQLLMTDVTGKSFPQLIDELDPAQLSRYTGVYRLGGQKNAKLYVQYPPKGAGPQELLPESERRFFVVSDLDVFDFPIEVNGLIKRQTRGMGRNAMTAKRFLTLRTKPQRENAGRLFQTVDDVEI
jgi:hypothetical protein